MATVYAVFEKVADDEVRSWSATLSKLFTTYEDADRYAAIMCDDAVIAYARDESKYLYDYYVEPWELHGSL